MWPTFYIPGLARALAPPPGPGDYCEIFEGEEYTESFTWTKPAGVKWVEVYAIGGGGGGGSGAVGVAQVVQGGQGGGGGEIRYAIFDADDLGDTETVTIGQGGAGGASVSGTGPNNSGNNGASGTATTFGAHLTAAGGGYGARGNAGVFVLAYDNGGGSDLTRVYISPYYYYIHTGNSGQPHSTANPNGGIATPKRLGGGGGGGGGSTGTTTADPLDAIDSPDGTVAGGVSGTGDHVNASPTAGASPADHDGFGAGAGGGGGGSGGYFPQAPGATSAPGAKAGKYGAGGGGGGGASAFGVPASVSGAGGAGSAGAIRFCYYFSDTYEYSNSVGDGDAPEAPAGFTLDDTRLYKVLRLAAPGQDPRNPCLPIGHPNDNQAWWEARYVEARNAGLVPNGWVYGTNYPAAQNFGYWKVGT